MLNAEGRLLCSSTILEASVAAEFWCAYSQTLLVHPKHINNYFEMLWVSLRSNILERVDLLWNIKPYIYNVLLGKLF